jgi:hypothetical protein
MLMIETFRGCVTRPPWGNDPKSDPGMQIDKTVTSL